MKTRIRAQEVDNTKAAIAQAQTLSAEMRSPINNSEDDAAFKPSDKGMALFLSLNALDFQIVALRSALELVTSSMFKEARDNDGDVRLASGLTAMAGVLADQSKEKFDAAWAAACPFFKGTLRMEAK